jgi:FixJ family two-component response regulator
MILNQKFHTSKQSFKRVCFYLPFPSFISNGNNSKTPPVEGELQGKPQSLDALSSIEGQVLSLIAHGFCSKEIGKILQLKLREVEMHRYNIKLKLNASTNKELVALSTHLISS